MDWPELDGHLFGLDNLPYGVVDRGARRSPVVRLGDACLDLAAVLAESHPDLADLFAATTLDPFLAAGPAAWSSVRAALTERLTDTEAAQNCGWALTPLDGARMVVPFTVGDYVDFYASLAHACNVGELFRPGQPPLPVNWRHLPAGYHGRSGTIVVSGTPVVRPSGQVRDGDATVFGPTGRLDFEAEVAYVVGAASSGPVGVDEFADHVFGMCLLNDWSARDLQAWETVPLGPFLGKSFATSVSAWITPLAALESARVEPPVQQPVPLPYLTGSSPRYGYDLDLAVEINGAVVSRPPFKSMYWTGEQMLAHLTINGASTRPGDVFASGTVSGSADGQQGCLLELSRNGTRDVAVGAEVRRFLHDHDTVTITATAPGHSGRIGLGEVSGQVVAVGSAPAAASQVRR